MSDEKEDISTPIMTQAEIERVLDPTVWNTFPSTDRPVILQRLAAEMNRRFSRSQLLLISAQNELLTAQNVGLEAQRQQNATQLDFARSLKTATWCLFGATFVLSLATLALVCVTAKH